VNFRNTLSDKDAHLVHRLEGFGDVVFGFSVSQLALQLNLPRTPQDLVGDPIRYFLYFATFAALAGFWLRFHRMLVGAFRPEPADLIAVFFYLAFIGLVPYALYANSHFAMMHSTDAARLGLAAYLLCIAMLSLASAVVQARNFRRGYALFTEPERKKAWQTTVATGAVPFATAFALTLDLTSGVTAGGLASALIGISVVIARRLARVPSAAFLRIRPGTNGFAPSNGANPAEAPAG
jgi:uncharacterized membrane protein